MSNTTTYNLKIKFGYSEKATKFEKNLPLEFGATL